MRMQNDVRLTRDAFAKYLRTGRAGAASEAPPIEYKFNPYHDPRNGRFTFAPGGPQALRSTTISGRAGTRAGQLPAQPDSLDPGGGDGGDKVRKAAPSVASSSAIAAEPGGSGPAGRGGNIRAFYDPMTLQQVFPNLGTAASRALIAPVDGFFNLKGPANELTAALVIKQAQAITAQIRDIDPTYHPQDGFPVTFQGQMNYLNGLRMDRAEAFYRIRGDAGPLQVETLRFLQRKVDEAYVEGIRALKGGGLKVTLSHQVALGNFIDRSARSELQTLYNISRIISHPQRPVRVVGREYQTGGTDRTYTIPDARVGNVAFDMTLTRKTFGMKQVRGFFASDFQPEIVIIIRPTWSGGAYAISRPRN